MEYIILQKIYYSKMNFLREFLLENTIKIFSIALIKFQKMPTIIKSHNLRKIRIKVKKKIVYNKIKRY